MGKAFENIGASFMRVVNTIIDNLKDFFETVRSFFQNVINDVWKGLDVAWEFITNILIDAFNSVGKWLMKSEKDTESGKPGTFLVGIGIALISIVVIAMSIKIIK